ncbi:hypothetical protein B0H66DRAFT_608624 [Apodospora peruviana]|uniref:Uncharacterized protein n=1 Tax=Apodospora peruviana TaxID=516989 RepID=A0AAE0HT37_9PEZI|nr:hypothetical protein B0H66DRAFT_608624 [Apodospora peruviana]
MDPLSITASVIALTQAASAQWTDEFLELLEELATLEGVLELTRASVEALQTLRSQNSGRGFAVLQTLQQQLRQCTAEIDELTKRMLAGRKGVDSKDDIAYHA